MKRRGAALGMVLAVVALVAIVAFAAAAAGTYNLTMSLHVDNDQRASLLAESAVNQAIAQIMANLNWSGDVAVAGSIPNSQGTLTFNRTRLPFSTNNAQGTNPNGFDRVVPPHMAELIGEGVSNGMVRHLQVLLNIPAFTVSISSSGQVTLKNSIIASLKNATDVTRDASGNITVSPDQLGPGDLSTNDSEVGAIVLDPNTLVTGNVQTCGTVIPNGATIEGEVRYPWQPVQLPDFNPTQYDPATTPISYQQFDGSTGPVGTQNLVGVSRAANGFTVNGDIVMDNALLYVDGDLTVSGGLRGNGAVVVTGKTTVTGGSNLTSDDVVALLSVGDVKLMGTSKNQNQFNGMVYTRGNFTADQFTIVGCFIADGLNPGQGKVTLTGCNALYVSSRTQLNFFYPRQAVLQAASLASQPGGAGYPSTVQTSDGNVVKLGTMGDPNAFQPDGAKNPPWWSPALAATHVNGQAWGGNPYTLGGSPSWADTGEPWNWYDTILLQILEINNQLVFQINWNDAGGPHQERYTDYNALQSRLSGMALQYCSVYASQNPGNLNVNLANAVNMVMGPVPPPNQPISANFTFDPNRFLNQTAKIRIVSWHEY